MEILLYLVPIDAIQRWSIKPKRNSLGDHTKIDIGGHPTQATSCEFNETNKEGEYKALSMGLQLAKYLQIKDFREIIGLGV